VVSTEIGTPRSRMLRSVQCGITAKQNCSNLAWIIPKHVFSTSDYRASRLVCLRISCRRFSWYKHTQRHAASGTTI